MASSGPFVDFYNILRVDPNCDSRTLETSYHSLAKTFHPDHAETADVTKLAEVIRAYRALKDPDRRAEYDVLYATNTGYDFTSAGDEIDTEKSPISDAEAHAKILLLLYKRRREQAQDAGVGRYYVQKMLNCSDELFDFHLWYLREKGFIITTEQGTLAITIEGVDNVIAQSRTAKKEKLLLSRTDEGSVQS